MEMCVEAHLSVMSSILDVYSCTGANSKVHYFHLQQNVCWLASRDQAKGEERVEKRERANEGGGEAERILRYLKWIAVYVH